MRQAEKIFGVPAEVSPSSLTLRGDSENRDKERASAGVPAGSVYFGIFFVSSSVLLFELALTRIFAVLLWAHLAFMVVGTALFGFGLSGVYLALNSSRMKKTLSFSTLSVLLSLSMIGSYLVIANVPFDIWRFKENAANFLYLIVWYTALIVPFYLAGIVVARLLTEYPKLSAVLYGVDLAGAAFGALLLIPVIPLAGGVGTVFSASVLALLAALLLGMRRSETFKGGVVLLLLLFCFVLPEASRIFPLQYHSSKRRFNAAVRRGRILATRWSPISRVDIARHKRGIYDIWIDGGTNESAIFQWNGDLATLKPLAWSSVGAPYYLKYGTRPRTMIIGPSGGKEVLFALSYQASHIDAVELDPSIHALLGKEEFREFMGNLYHNRKVTFVNDEGRAFLRRQPSNYYDVIQFVNNYTPAAMAAGALNLSETFLLTKEAFKDYFNHLTANGVLALHRGATLRVALTAMKALEELGIKNANRHILIFSGEVDYFEGFLLKKSPWTEEETGKIYTYIKDRPRTTRRVFLWTPFDPGRNNLYSKIISSTPSRRSRYYKSLGVNLFPASDDRPFMEHFLQIGKKNLPENLPKEFLKRNAEKWGGIVPRGDFPYVVILLESAVLAFLFVILPLVLFAGRSVKSPGFPGFLVFFAALGFSFIAIEISLMKRYVLFLGNPSYSITAVLVALLLGAGVGSISVQKRSGSTLVRSLALAVSLIVIVLLAETVLAPVIFNAFLHLSFAGRVITTFCMLFPLGFCMGMPFPLGLKLINATSCDEQERQRLTAWAWGINGYFTVIGSAAAVFIALFAGFKVVLITALCGYLIGTFAVRLFITRSA